MRINLPSALGILIALFPLTTSALFSQGCPGLGNITLNVVAAPVPTITGNNQFCQGAGTTLTVAQNFDSYTWSTGDNSPSIDVDNPGTYTVTVTNSAGCTGTATQTVTQSPAPVPAITSAFYNCNGTFTVSVSSGFSAYIWSSGQTSETVIVNGNDTYSVTVTGANGCTGTTSITVVTPPEPIVTITGDNEICANSSSTLNATSGFLAYSWNTGGNGASITVTNAGTYTVTVTDANGCTDAATFSVSEVPAPVPAITGPQAICANESGTLSVTQSFPTYSWNTGASTQSIDVNTAGNYTVTVTDATGCTGTASFNLSVNPNPVPNITAAPYACNSQITLNGGSGFSSYSWSTGQSGNPVSVNADGTYGLTVTAATGCTGTATFNVTIPPPPVVNISGDNVICSNASGTLDATPGFSAYTWNTGSNSPSITVTNPGTYTVTATDAFGCTDAATFSVSEVPAPVPAITGPQAICANESGTLSVTQSFPTYNWSTGASTQSIDVNAAGNYTVTVTDATGCTGTASFNLSVNPNPVPNITAAPYACNGQITLNGGSGFSSYSWSTGQSGNPVSVNADGTYGLTVTAANGCTGTDALLVNIPPPPSVGITGNPQFCQGDNSVLAATPGLNAYVWSTGQTGPSITVFNAGTYTVTATDGFGCTATDALAVSILPAPVPTITGQNTVCAGETTIFNVPGSFGSYVWSNGFVGQSITVGSAGTYTVTVTDFDGCTGTAAQALAVLPAPQPNISAAPYTCNSQLSLSAGNGFTTYAWSTGQSGNPITVNTDGTYSVTVTSANGCTGTNAFFANIPDVPVVGIGGDDQICQGSSTTLDATPGFGAYVWSSGQTGPSITVSAAGNYEVTATDGFGCTGTAVFPVQVVPNPTPVIAGPTSICAGGSATFTVPGNFSAYAWSSGGNTSSITVSNAGTYTVTVTASNGCTGTAGQTLTISTSLEPQIAEEPYACNGQIGLDAGTGFSTYAWSNGASTSTITVNTSGLYTVTVSDNTGCTGTDVVAVNIPDAPIVGISGPGVICQNTGGVLEATPGFGIYVWSNNQVGDSIVVTQAGTYSVTATDAFGCTAEAEFVLSVNPAPTTSISGPTVICSNSSGTLSAVGNFQTYLWSTADNTPSITVNAAGAYTVTVTNNFGCTGTAAQTVTVLTNLEPEIAALPYACNGQITLDAGAGFATYLWSSGQNTATISVGTAGDYTVTVTDVTGCTGTDVLAVSIPVLPVVSISGNTVFCENSSTALAATPGFVTYEWSTGAATPDISVNATGNFTVTVTDALGCTATAAASATAQPLPAPTIAGPAAICTNSSGTLSVGGNFATYAWSTAETTASITVNAAGNYAVTVTDQFGCTGSTTQTVSVVTQLTPTVSALPYACNGQITLDAGAGFATYLWSSGQNTATISVGTAGDYTVTVTDATGCTGTDVLAVSIPAPPVVSISGNTVFCENAGTALAATPGFVTYEWSTGAATPDISVNATGNFTVTVTDALGCTATAAASATAQPLPAPTIAGPAAICTNSSGILSVGGNFATYAWSTAETTASITVNAAGDYAVTVTDQFGCTGSTAQTVSVVTQLTPTVSALPYACNGQITLDAGAGFATYLWSSGQNTATISVGTAGDYTVTVTDVTGCTGTDVLAVSIPVLPVVSISGNTVFCENSSTALAATPGFVTYEWSTGAATPDISVNATGNFTVTVTDALGCTATAAASATAQPLPAPTIAGPAAICTNSSGTLSVGGNFATYAWSTAETTASITVNAAGDYAVTVTDQFGCTGSTAQTVSIVTQLTPTVSALPYACNGQITLDAGAGFATYLWSSGQNTATISVGTAGDYTVTVTDVTGCTGTDVLAVTIPAPQVVSISGNTVFCENAGTALAATPGFVTYAWSTGAATPDISVNATGSFTVTVTDALGCTATAAASATAQPLPAPTIAGPAAICTNSSGTLSVGGNFATYAWSTAETTASITVNAAGNYAVTVTDQFGCTGSTTQTVSVVTQLTPTVSALPYACNGQITLDAGAGFATYLWSSGQNTATISVGTAGDYTVTVTDATGCTGTDVLAVSIPVLPVVSISGNTVFCENSSTALAATPGFVTYEWSTGVATPDISVNATGNFTVTVTDALGCTATAAASATAQPLPVPTIAGPAAICTNSSGTLSVGGNFATYAWSTAETTASITVNAAGDYAVTVTDQFGCTGSTAQTVSVVTQLTPAVSALPYACDGQITLDAGAGFATYLWSNGQTTPTISTTLPGNYTVTVTDVTGCTGTAVALATIPTPPVVAVSGNPVFCANSSTAFSATSGFVTYLWSTNETTSGITVNATGNYSVTVTDALGCTATAVASATAQPLPAPTIAGPAAICPGSTGTLSAGGNFAAYNWSTAQTAQTITVGNAGTYAVTVTDLLGCTGTAATTIIAATADTAFVQLSTCDPSSVGTNVQVFPGTGGCDSVVVTQTVLTGVTVSGTTAVLSNFNGFAVACAGGSNGEAIATPATGTAPFTYTWSNGATAQVAQNLSAGTYGVTFTDANGCSGTASVLLGEPAAVEPVIDATDPTCQNAGIIEVTQVTGGTGPYTVRLVQDIGVTNGTQPLNFSTLDAGTFEVEVTDANGCKSAETVVLLPADIVEEFVSDTFEINKGDTVVLNAGAGITIQPLFITWTPVTDLSCNNCLNPSIAPVRTTLVELDVAGFGGCSATGLFLIIVKSGGQIYVPNVIKPGSADNFGFTIYGDDRLVNIRSLQVYDRWGGQMAVFNNLTPNEPSLGWDGRFRGEDMMPGVYVWWAEVEYSDGTTEVLSGDVTVVR